MSNRSLADRLVEFGLDPDYEGNIDNLMNVVQTANVILGRFIGGAEKKSRDIFL